MKEVKEEKAIQEENIEDVKIEENYLAEQPKKAKKKITPWSIIKMILLIITSPIWFPWKILFVRRKGNKFKDVSLVKKIFRIVRFPITKTIKFTLFLFIIGVEVTLVYKLRYSPITYTITRSSVHKYYLKEDNNKTELLGLIDNVYASDIAKHYDEFKTAFDYIDTWDLKDKNKMYVILNADLTKMFFKYFPDDHISFILDKFNDDETFRTNVKYIVQDINKILSRLMKELPTLVPYEEIQVVIQPIASATSVSMDYAVVLDALGGIIKPFESEFEITDNNVTMSEEEVEYYNLFIDIMVDYSRGKSLKTIYDELNDNNIIENKTTNESAIISAN